MPAIGPATLDHPLANGIPPSWAAAWGDDDYGPWAEIHIGDAKQSLRWIPPGTFLMGAPESEWKPLGFDLEGPQHPVTISRGFWLFETPCTQAVWEAVMGENPSHFEGADRPVENVTWQDCQQFIEALKNQLPDLQLTLPTEAEWEYACRAGTATSTYAGDLAIDKSGHAAGLEEIAWYKANAGGETHKVAELQPNDWGLYDMLGNVWEWCRDQSGRPYSIDPITDPVYEARSASAYRVIRGGSWGDSARNARAAFRGGYRPGDRDRGLGFRCSSSGERASRAGGGTGAERSQPSRSRRRQRSDE